MKSVIISAIIMILLGGLVYVAKDLNFGKPAISDLDDYFIRHGQDQCGANNIVTSVVFDFRGFDTLGEATVLFTAVLGVGIMFRKMLQGEENEND
ncbi:MAG: hydrogen gas-evolving membrane-bound hydrogenase subunit E [Lentisphaerota bacterium]